MAMPAIPSWLREARVSKYRYPVVAHVRIIELLEQMIELEELLLKKMEEKE